VDVLFFLERKRGEDTILLKISKFRVQKRGKTGDSLELIHCGKIGGGEPFKILFGKDQEVTRHEKEGSVRKAL